MTEMAEQLKSPLLFPCRMSSILLSGIVPKLLSYPYTYPQLVVVKLVPCLYCQQPSYPATANSPQLLGQASGIAHQYFRYFRISARYFRISACYFRISERYFRISVRVTFGLVGSLFKTYSARYFRLSARYVRISARYFRISARYFRVSARYFRISARYFRISVRVTFGPESTCQSTFESSAHYFRTRKQVGGNSENTNQEYRNCIPTAAILR